MATSPFSGNIAMVVDLWRRNFNPKVPKQPQAAKMLSVCARLCVSHKFLLICNAENTLVCNGTESMLLFVLREFCCMVLD